MPPRGPAGWRTGPGQASRGSPMMWRSCWPPWSRRPKPLGVTHWSTRLLGKHLGIANVKVADAWRDWGVQPWRKGRSSSPPTPSWRPRSATSSGCTSTRRTRRSCCAWMRNLRPRRSNATRRCCPSGRDPRKAQPRLQAQRHHHAVRRAGDRHRQGHSRCYARHGKRNSWISSNRSLAPTPAAAPHRLDNYHTHNHHDIPAGWPGTHGSPCISRRHPDRG